MKRKKVAIATSDGKLVNRHFGNSENFLIVDLFDDGSCDLICVREFEDQGIESCSSQQRMEKRVEMLKDCDVIIANKIGLCALEKLSDKIVLERHGLVKDAIKEVLELFMT
ncbi:NifB/NifX family molybdenum-iron cluster-binding protein [Anaerocellum danielii]|uniref:NifB/NifX family molybdenum-iron cluster-binding protein n=1 Tax=Anaerocellum danielii TaxID=1387557 RepID=A0ABZ0U1W3_9FIRM|nr:NifB/NifX family molybdenum-iron cluster-binding protein [Caldicellulosiruptor danielii]WPX09286.1 NifB/NifX family molybdenum-iron cluster-binding protein [Caldicellulosiruptor danielii]